ncbi:MAG: glycosyltransferase family 2 protein [Clostridia bacterium]|nr:glycosyltransferase family 2 protein [Clostridia bacterium]
MQTFSIIIPMKNADRYIKNALDSIAQQQFDNIEVLVIDDNSDNTDISKYIVDSWKNKHPNISLKSLKTTKEQGGPGGARNIGLDNARGEYILFLDADDKLNDNALQNIKNAIDENPDTDVFVLGYQLTRRDQYETDKKTFKAPAGKLQESRFFQIGANTAGTIWNCCFKRTLFGEKDEDKIRFKPNCKFEDLPTKVNLFVRNKKRIKSIPAITHTQYSRRNTSVTGTLLLKDLKQLIDAHYEIANIKKSESKIGLKDRIYIDARKVSLINVSSWLIQKAIRNNLDRRRKNRADRKQVLEDEIRLGM